MRQMDLLWKLQDLDTRIGELEKKLAVYANKTKLRQLKSKFDTEKGLLEKEEAALKATIKSLKSNRVKVEELKFNYEKTEQKLYSGEVSNVKQLEGMQKNLDEMQRNMETLETDYGNYQGQKTRLEDLVKTSKVKLKKWKNTFNGLKEKYTKEEKEAKAEYQDITKKRQELIKKIDESILNRYERVRLGTDMAVVAIENGKCSGCHMEVSVVYTEKLKEDALVNCETCGRILYPKKD